MFEVFNNAAAMCEAAHLASLKSYTAKFMSYLTHKYDTDSGLRPPTFLEAQSADKQVHAVIFELVSERGWSIDQALHEMTSVRADLPMLLQPRPRPYLIYLGGGFKCILCYHPYLGKWSKLTYFADGLKPPTSKKRQKRQKKLHVKIGLSVWWFFRVWVSNKEPWKTIRVRRCI